MSTLAERLKAETRAAHTSAERSRFMGRLLRGQLSRPDYVELLRNLQAIYAVLEPGLRCHADHPVLSPLFPSAGRVTVQLPGASLVPQPGRPPGQPLEPPQIVPALWRNDALIGDLTVLHGPSWAADIAIRPATADYLSRLHNLSASIPGLLLSHAYVRYLGDLSGGQLLRRIVRDSMGLSGDAGTAFYRFGSEDETRLLTRAFRDDLDRVVVDPATEDALVEEALLSFRLHQRLFDELATHCGIA